MGLISFTPLADGVTGVNAAATNTPLSTIYNDYNGNITNANLSASAAIAFSKIAGGSATALASWATWSPSWTNVTVGNGVVTAKWVQVGKSVYGILRFVMGTTSSITGAIGFSLPITASATYDATKNINVGFANFEDAGVASYSGALLLASSLTVASPQALVATGTYLTNAGANASTPFTFGTGDYFDTQFFYETT